MSDIQYDTRTGAVMAGGLTGSGRHAGAAAKKVLAALREACPQAKSKSNQELSLLLENYNDQVDLVIEALRSGESDGVLGGWATTAKKGKGGKGKKNSESETLPPDNVSETSNSKNRVPPAALVANTKSKDDGKSIKKPEQLEPQEKTNFSNKDAEARKEKSHSKPESTRVQPQIPPAKEVPIPDIHGHSGAFIRLAAQLGETRDDDLAKLDFAFEQIRQAVKHRHDTLRRGLERNHDQANQVLHNRLGQSAALLDRVAQSGALMPKEYGEWQQDVTTFTADYKFDLHLATTPRFSYSLEALQNELNNFGNVASISPVYSFKPATIPHIRQLQEKIAHPNQHVQQQSHPVQHPKQHNSNSNSHRISASDKTARPQHQQQQHHQPAKPQQPRPEPRERVVIVPKEAPGSAPLNSLVISGSDLTPEELANLTRSLESSLRFAPPTPKPLFNNGGEFNTQSDIFSDGAVWTNSNNTFHAEQWNPEEAAASQLPGEQLPGEHVSNNGPNGPPRNGRGPRGGGYRGAGGRGTRGQTNGRGGGRPFRGARRGATAY